jgi:RNA polymerase sigma-70 factor (ECF subfamily)
VISETSRRSNADWIAALQSTGIDQATALTDLRTYLRRAALFTLRRARHHVGHLGPGALEALAEDCAQEALTAILQHLQDFRGKSRFTTWAYAFAVNIALIAARRERWATVSLDRILDDGVPMSMTHSDNTNDPDPERRALQAEVAAVVHEGIDAHLTPRQQRVLRALVVEQIPLDEIVRHWGSNRNAIYKLVHDARLKLKRHLVSRGFDLDEIFAAFSGTG